MKSLFRSFLGVVALGGLLFWFLTRPATLSESEIPEHQPDLDNGEKMAMAGGCTSCHGEDLSGGLEMDSAYGLFRVPNISPHPEAGIGDWTDAEFASAMLNGVSPSGRHYYPAFPYASYTRMNLPDVLDLKAWIDSLEPVASERGVHELAFPWSVRRGIGLWKRLYLDNDPVIGELPAGAELERGRYLVEGPGHCGECHTPRDLLGGLRLTKWLSGAPAMDGEGKVPNITPAEKGLADWSEKDIAYFFESGFLPDFDMVGGSMVKVQENLARLPESDRRAIAAYLKAIPPE